MSIAFESPAESNEVFVQGDLTIYTIAEAKQALAAIQGMRINLSQVAEADGAGLQLLLALKRDAHATFVAPSEAVRDMLRLAGQSALIDPAGGKP